MHFTAEAVSSSVTEPGAIICTSELSNLSTLCAGDVSVVTAAPKLHQI